MPPPPPEQEEEGDAEKPLPPRPKPKPPKPKPKPSSEPKPKPLGPLPERDAEDPGKKGVGVATTTTSPPDLFCADTCAGACAFLPTCHPPPPPPSPGATVHLRSSSRLPTPLIALSASLLAVSAALLLALLIHRLVSRRRRRRAQNAAVVAHHDVEAGGGAQVLAGAVGAGGGGEEVEVEEADGGVHHVWYIRTKGLDERAIAAIAAVVYDGGKRKKSRGGGDGGGGVDGDDGDGSCAVCLAEFRDGETLRLLPACAHAFHRGCIDTWLRAHVNCPLCRAPVVVHLTPSPSSTAGGANAGDPSATPGERLQEAREPAGAVGGGGQTEETARGGGVVPVPDRGVRRAASMVTLPRRAWPADVSVRLPAASSSGREEDMTGLGGKLRRLLKLSEAMEMAGIGVERRSVSFGGAGGRCQRLPPPWSEAAGVSADDGELVGAELPTMR